MTTPNVNAPVQIPAGAQEITSGKAKGEREDQSFMDVLSIADSAARTREPEKDIKADTKTPKDPGKTKENPKTDTSKPENVKKDPNGQEDGNVRETARTEKKEDVRDDAKANNDIKEAIEDVKAVIKEKLDIGDEELTQVMETLGLTMTDLLEPGTMTDIVAAVKDVTPVDIVADDTLSGIVTELQSTVREVTSDLVQKLDVTPEEFKEIKNTFAENITDTTEYEVVSLKPDKEVKENTQDLKAKAEVKDYDRIVEEPQSDTVRTPAEAVKVVKTEVQPDRTERISDTSEDGQEVSLKVTVKDQRDQGTAAGNNGSESQTSPEDFIRSEGRVRNTEAHAETSVNHNSIFFQNLNTAVENTLEAMTGTEAATPSTTMVDAMDLINQINSQIRAVIDNETQSLSMQLHPQSLGRLNVELIAKAGQLTAQFEAENASVKAALETRLVELKETLEQRGVRVESVEVTVASHEFEQNLMGGEQSQDASGQPGRRSGRTRSINLNEDGVEGIDGEDTPEEERIARDMMAANGNSVDYMA